jgi:hypothetical protein
VTAAAEPALPRSGAAGFALRALALAAIPALLFATGFFRADERERIGLLAARLRGAGA